MKKIQVRTESGVLVQEVRLKKRSPNIRIGRNGTNEIVLDDSRISRRHAEISVTEDGIALQDSGSTYGTTVNGQALKAKSAVVIHAGDRILLGGRYLVVVEDGADPSEAAALTPSNIGESVRRNVEFFGGLLETLTGKVKGLAANRALSTEKAQAEAAAATEAFRAAAEQRIRELATLQEMSLRMSEIHDFELLLEAVMGMALEVSGAERGFLMLLSEETNQLETLIGKGPEPRPEDGNPVGRIIAERSFHRNEVVIISNAAKDLELAGQTSEANDTIKSVIVAPLQIHGEVVGVLYLDNRDIDHCFSERNVDFLKAFAAQASVALYNARLFNQAVMDGLTGLFNDRFFRQRLGEEIRRAQRQQKPLALVLFEVDHFESHLKTCGRSTGDRILRAIRKIIRATVRVTDVAARCGESGFGVVLTDTEAQGAWILAERLRERIQAINLSHAGKALSVTSSFGVALLTVAETGREDLLRQAEEALARSKAAGYNRCTRAQAASG